MPDLNQTKSTLESLALTGCKISELKPYYFRGFENLQQLNLESNEFTQLKDYTFDGLSALLNLKMANNKITATEWFTFHGLSSLQGFYAYSGYLTTFPCVGPFSPFLNIFQVHGNKIENFPANCTQFANVTDMRFYVNNLQGVTINNALNTFTKVGFFHFKKVGKVCFEFDGVNQLKLSTGIDITENNLKYFPVKNCSVNNTEPDERALDLPVVENLYLQTNELLQLPNISLLVNLKKLYLRHNKLTKLPLLVFAGNKILNYLDMSNNQFTNLPPLVFSSNEDLQHIDISTNLLTEAPDLTGGCKSLTKLQLGSNKITGLPPNYFSGCPVLTDVSLSHNLLTAIPSLTPIGNSLTKLNLDHNQITGHVSADSFLNLTAMHTSNFDSNQITSFDMSLLQHTPSFYQLSFRRNNLQTEIGDPYRWCSRKACVDFRLFVDFNSKVPCDESRCWAKRYPTPIKSYFGKCFGKFWKHVTLADLKCPGDVYNFC